jgi:hydrogenase maturation protein HypF
MRGGRDRGAVIRASRRSRVRLRVDGIVQGVGFRPYVHALATGLGLAGSVHNDVRGVVVEVEGGADVLEVFVATLRSGGPPMAVIEGVTAEAVEPLGQQDFVIDSSDGAGSHDALVSPDVGTCDDCLRELRDPQDRRFRYPFVNCTNCGPRFTIVAGVPYDRVNTTMARFVMCGECAAEYRDPSNRRFHAEPVCCPACGPRLVLVDGAGRSIPGEPIVSAAALLSGGAIVAVKGLGGYHLAALAASDAAVDALRARKHREEKPFAVMVPSVDVARRLCVVDDAEAAVLESPARPIVLLRRRTDSPVAQAVAPGNRSLGLMLPSTPLHHLLLGEVGAAIVLTSGNVSDEPIATDDAEALERLRWIADAFLTHDRAIRTRADDSVTRVFRGREMVLRRSRGHAPRPVTLARPVPRPLLGCGAELKSTFCLARANHAFVSHHIGDLENFETLRAYTDGITHFSRLFDVVPEVVAHDLHPDYLSTKHALALDGVELVGVQHHHAHIASCLADNGVDGPVVGVAFDGLGYGTDGTIWGGEILVADHRDALRIAHLATVPMPGGTAAIREPWRMAAAYLHAVYGDAVPDGLAVMARNARLWADVLAMAAAGINSPATSSAGRLFDAVASLLGVRDHVSYEGQAAIELEQRADLDECGSYDVSIDGHGDALVIRSEQLVRAAVDDLMHGVPVPSIAARVHNGVAAMVERAAVAACERHGLDRVALSGGVFQNLLLLDATVDRLERAGLRVLTHSRVPPNDGGISLGQVAVAAARL